MKQNNQILELIDTLNVKEKTFNSLDILIKNNPTIDNRVTDQLKYEFSGVEIQIPDESEKSIVIIGKIDIIKKTKIGYFEHHIDTKGEFIDEYYVFL